MLMALLVWCAQAADDLAWSQALGWVDRIGWAEEDRSVDALVRQIHDGAGPFAASVRPELGDTLVEGPLYAVEAEVLDEMTLRGRHVRVRLRQAIAYDNPANKPIDQLVLRVFPSASARIWLQGVWVDNQRVAPAMDGSLLVLPLPEPLPPKRTARILLHLEQEVPSFDPMEPYEADVLDTAATGLYGYSGGYVNLGHWLPMVLPVNRSGRANPQPLRPNTEHAKFPPAYFHVVLTAPARMRIATGGSEILRRQDASSTTVVAVAAGARDFPAQLGAHLEVVEAEVEGLRVRVFHPATDDAMGGHLLGYATRAVETFTELFGPLRQSEIDIVETPIRVALGVEYSGLVTVDVHHKVGVYSPKDDHEWTVAHEVAHQWWGSEVGNDPGAEPWLDEALATFSAALYWERHHGRASLETRYRNEILQPTRALQRAGVPDLPANLPAWRYDLDQYGAIVYGRAALFFEALEHELGEENLLAALRHYHRTQRDHFASEEDLMRSLGMHGDRDALRRLHKRWISEGHGYEDLLAAPQEDADH
ncbi:MAG: hypothetical protein KTR31_17090 [Myxococcales bacterium]|nr:hypothetical protein [Myxococcales bacterium]